MEYYRFITNGVGIYESVSKEVSVDDVRRSNKPDGSWLQKKGTGYPGAISFWTEIGLQKYVGSGLLAWHRSVLKEDVEVVIIDKPEQVLYEDEYQIICNGSYIKVKEKMSLDQFLKGKVPK